MNVLRILNAIRCDGHLSFLELIIDYPIHQDADCPHWLHEQHVFYGRTNYACPVCRQHYNYCLLRFFFRIFVSLVP